MKMGIQLRVLLIVMDTDRKWHVKGKVSVRELHGPKVRGASGVVPPPDGISISILTC